MRWRNNEQLKNDEEMIVTFFAYTPEKVGTETRWLEQVTIRKKYVKSTKTKRIGNKIITIDTSHWINVEFIDEEK